MEAVQEATYDFQTAGVGHMAGRQCGVVGADIGVVVDAARRGAAHRMFLEDSHSGAGD
jgi:hypothetical protein